MTHKFISHTILGNRFFVYRIQKINYYKRLFCIFDKDVPYELFIEYRELNSNTVVKPFIGINTFGSSFGFQYQQKIDFTKNYTFRLFSKDECEQHIKEINEKKKFIEEMLSEYNDQFYIDHNRKMFEKSIKTNKN